jgi:hypothetical protein
MNEAISLVCGPASLVGIATDYGLDGPGAHPASCTVGTGFFPGGKVQPGRAADHSPPSSAKFMEE